MKVLILEDENMAVKRLTGLLQQLDTEIEVLDVLDSVKSAVKWLSSNEADLLFSTFN